MTDEQHLPLEVRWFVSGRLPKAVRAGRPHQIRTDEYYLPSLARDFALKRRGGALLERKWLVEPARPVLVDGRTALAERWRKDRRAVSIDTMNPACWQSVRKSLWQIGDVELAEVVLDRAPWWTLAVRSAGERFPPIPRQLSKLLQRVEARSCSYSSWMLERQPPFG